MNNDFLGALQALNVDSGIPIDYMLDRIEKAIITACKNTYGNENAFIKVNDTGNFEIKLNKIVVEDPKDFGNEISLEDAKNLDNNLELGQICPINLDPKKFGRIAAQTARNIIRQGIKDKERERIVNSLKCSEGQILSAKILRIIPESKDIILKVGEVETNLSEPNVSNINFIQEGNYLKVYIVRVESTNDGAWVVVSRTCPEFVKKLFELEIPEIVEGTIEIKAIVREFGVRTKIAVISNDINVDPIGACVGTNGMRIKEILKELGDEKIDIIKFYNEPEKFIESALAPAKIISVVILSTENTEQKACRVVVPDNQLSLAIGLNGQNVRLASKISGWKIDLKSE
ncbi:MAG: transcription termination/antitermination protein NusA [Candidatus Improbicoccus devescovinae]|nr:MAG: transcription termination/antitermination protein NusA [Candidatus Improbicoccus devescovinae]